MVLPLMVVFTSVPSPTGAAASLLMKLVPSAVEITVFALEPLLMVFTEVVAFAAEAFSLPAPSFTAAAIADAVWFCTLVFVPSVTASASPSAFWIVTVDLPPSTVDCVVPAASDWVRFCFVPSLMDVVIFPFSIFSQVFSPTLLEISLSAWFLISDALEVMMPVAVLLMLTASLLMTSEALFVITFASLVSVSSALIETSFDSIMILSIRCLKVEPPTVSVMPSLSSTRVLSPTLSVSFVFASLVMFSALFEISPVTVVVWLPPMVFS